MEKKKSSVRASKTLDELDFAILSYMQADGRASFTEISEKENVSVGTVRTRFTRLIKAGILNIVGRVDPNKVGFNSYAHIAIYIRPASLKEKIAKAIAKMSEVSFLAGTSGEYDLEVDVMCRNNEHLTHFVNTVSAIEGVLQTKTTIYFKVYKYAQPDLMLLAKEQASIS